LNALATLEKKRLHPDVDHRAPHHFIFGFGRTPEKRTERRVSKLFYWRFRDRAEIQIHIAVRSN